MKEITNRCSTCDIRSPGGVSPSDFTLESSMITEAKRERCIEKGESKQRLGG